MALRFIKSSWWVDLRSDHQRYRIRSPENSRSGAKAYEATLRRKLARGEELARTRGATPKELLFEQFALTWFDEYVVPNNKYSEQRTKKYVLSASLIPFFGKTPIEQITTHQVERYKAHLIKSGVTNKTVNNRLTILNTCLSTAHDWLKLKTEQPRIKRLKCISARTDYLTAEECRQLLTSSDGVVFEMILAALRTGMRQGEMRGLQWSSIDWETRRLVVRHSLCDFRKILDTPKSNRERSIPLDTDLYEALMKRKKSAGFVFVDQNHQPFNHHRLSAIMSRACKRAKLRKITWHVLRHTFASHLAMNGVPLNVVQTLLGHSSIITTMRYAHVAPSTLRTAIDLLNPRTALSLDVGQPVGNHWLEARRKEAA